MNGRWPANVILSSEMAEVLDEQTGDLAPSSSYQRGTHAGHNLYGNGMGQTDPGYQTKGYGDSGGASKYFLTAGYEQWELEWIYSVGLRPCGTEQ